jgi:hypothetical protein
VVWKSRGWAETRWCGRAGAGLRPGGVEEQVGPGGLCKESTEQDKHQAH